MGGQQAVGSLVEAVEDIEVGDPEPLRGRSDGGEGSRHHCWSSSRGEERGVGTLAGDSAEGRDAGALP